MQPSGPHCPQSFNPEIITPSNKSTRIVLISGGCQIGAETACHNVFEFVENQQKIPTSLIGVINLICRFSSISVLSAKEGRGCADFIFQFIVVHMKAMAVPFSMNFERF
jgi:hypothetical protein